MTIVNNQVTMYTNVTKHSGTLQKLYGLQYRNIHVHSHLPVFHREPLRPRWSTAITRFPDNARGVQPLSTRSIMMETPSDRGDFPRSRKIVHDGSVVDGRNRARRST